MADEDCIYDDYDVDDSTHGDGGVAVMFESLYVSNDVANQPWYCGRIDRAESERRLKQGGRAGNFLVRMKGDDGNVFVHSYLSLTRMVIIHNLIQFKPNGSCIVDDKPFPFSQKPLLADVVDKLQELRRARKVLGWCIHAMLLIGNWNLPLKWACWTCVRLECRLEWSQMIPDILANSFPFFLLSCFCVLGRYLVLVPLYVYNLHFGSK